MASCKNDFLCTLQSEPLLIINLPLCPLFSHVITTKIVIELITLHYLANLKYKYIYGGKKTCKFTSIQARLRETSGSTLTRVPKNGF